VGLLILLINVPFASVAGQDDVLPVTGRISDHGEMLSKSQKHLIYQVLAQHESARHHHIALLTAVSSGGLSASEYARQIWQGWKRKGKSTGVLMVLIKEQGSAAIIVGEDLRALLDKEAVGVIIREIITPPLSESDYDTAALEGLKGILVELNR
jgi:uncharacterized membrane protein YgcG